MVEEFGLRVKGLGLMAQGSGLMVCPGCRFLRVEGAGCMGELLAELGRRV
jgi:cytochrome P450